MAFILQDSTKKEPVFCRKRTGSCRDKFFLLSGHVLSLFDLIVDVGLHECCSAQLMESHDHQKVSFDYLSAAVVSLHVVDL